MAMQTSQRGFLDLLMDNFERIYLEESKRIVEKHKEDVSRELDQLRDEIVTRASLQIKNQVKVSGIGSEITISILKDTK